MAKYKITEKQLKYVQENLKIQSTVMPDNNLKLPNSENKTTLEIEREVKEVIQKVIDKFKYLPKTEKENFKEELEIFLSKF